MPDAIGVPLNFRDGTLPVPPRDRSVAWTRKAAQPPSVWWISRPPALALLAATGLLSLVVLPPATLNGQVDNEPSSAQTLALNPERIAITITGDFEFFRRPTSFDRAV